MKKSLPAILLILFVCTACPYKSVVTLNENEAVDINTSIIGKWKAEKKSKESDSSYVEITGQNKKYRVVVYDYSGETPSNNYYNAYAVQLKNDPILCIKEDKDSLFYFLKVESNKSKLSLFPISDEIIKEQFSDAQSLKAYMTSHNEDKGFYEKPLVLFRIKK